ncbi:DUF4157 domain-containing protein [Paraburkholderia sp. 32]|uniref:eCIS core domain-containing protein n=1 Tax=Paraburkholderia sp. 32 TaxID=2991057 RepID=UPI003D1AC3A3
MKTLTKAASRSVAAEPGKRKDHVPLRSQHASSDRASILQPELGNQAIQTLLRPSALQTWAAAGNLAMQHWLQGNGIHPKLALSQPGDPEECEADSVADAIVDGSSVPAINHGRDTGASDARDNEALSCKSEGASGPTHGATQALSALHMGNGEALPRSVRRDFEMRLGLDLGGVRVHTDAAAADAARGLGARAYTVGTSIAFANGEYRPLEREGKWLLAHELAHVAQASNTIRRDTIAGAQPLPMSVAGAPTVYWGLDTSGERHRPYISIPPPGRELTAVAAFVYGSAEAAAALRDTNPGAADFLPPGAVLRLAPGTLTQAARQSFQRALDTGQLLRTAGIPDGAPLSPDAKVHQLSIAGQTYNLLDAQFVGMLRGMAWHLSSEAGRLNGLCEVYLQTRREHIEKSNNVIRGISDWMGGVSVPDEAIYAGPRDRATGIVADLARGEPTQQLIIDASRRLRNVMEEYRAGEKTWSTYIQGTISGAERTAADLEVVRDSCFAIEAGLAGAVVAPLAFAAAGGGALGVGAAIGGGAMAGGVVRGSLDVALPGMQADRPASQRFVSGFKSGAVQGGIGAAGALVAPAVSGAIAPHLGITAGAAPTVGQQIALGAASGFVLGAPSGAVAAALNNVQAFSDGRMTTLQYFVSIGIGAAGGAAGGAVFGMLPIQGLYRSGGQPLNPFSGEPVMPRWMMAGPYSPLQSDWNPPPDFNDLAATELPPLPENYGWVRINDVWEPINLVGPNRRPLTLRIYGPDAAGKNNYNILAGPELVQSSAVARPTGATYPPGSRGNMPFNTADFTDNTGQTWIVGHNVDYADTNDLPNVPDSNADPANYTPEPAWWGLYLRNFIVRRLIRPNGGGYRQMNFYSGAPRMTTSGNPIPDGVYFVQTDPNGVAIRAWRIPFAVNGPTGAANLPQFEIPLNQVPAGLLSPTPAPPIGAVGGSAGGQATTRPETQ